MKHRIAQAVILVFLSLLLSCNEGPYQLFYTVVNDTLLNNNDLDDTLSVTGMTEIAGNYYITAGNIRYRPQSSTSWGAASIATAVHNYITGDGTDLYVSVIDEVAGGGGSRLYYCAGASTAAAMPVTGIANLHSILKVKYTGSAVYAACKILPTSSPTYSLCSVATTTGTPLYTGLTTPITDFTAGAGNVYYVSGTSVYLGVSVVTPTGSTGTFSGIFYDAASGRVFAGTQNGMLYRSTDASCSAWESVGPKTYIKNNNPVNVSFTEFVSVSPTFIVVGTRGAGFWGIDTSSGFVEASVVRFADSSVADLYNGAIETFYVDPSDKDGLVRVFFCTMGAGLWSNTYSAGWGTTWTRE